MKLDIHEFGVKTFIDLFDYSSDLIYVCNQSGELVDVNRTVIDSYGYPKTSLIGKNFKVLTAEDLTDLDELFEVTKNVWLNEEEKKIEIWGKRRDGSVFLKEVVVRCGVYFGKKVLIGTGRDITERKRYEQQLIEGKENLEKLNQELDAFVWKVSHDLRGPLASVKGIINLIQLEGVSDNQQEYCTHMETSVSKLIEFIKELEVVARNKTSEIKTEKIDFKVLIEELLTDYLYGSLTDNCDIEISVGEIGQFYSDINRLRSVFLNLISNALKYKSNRKPKVTITIVPKASGIKCLISDNGIGIEKPLQDKVFDMFFRVSAELEGSGLGLYIVKEAVVKLGGSVGLSSTVGKGTTVEFWLPNLNMVPSV